MNRWKKNLAASLAGAVGLMMGSTVLAEETASPDLVSLFYTYSGDNLVFDYSCEDYLNSARQLEKTAYSGFLALKQVDMNWDGEEELLAIRIKNETNEEGIAENVLLGEVYQYQGNKLQRLAQYELADNVLSGNMVRTDVFLVQTDSGVLVCCEEKEVTSVLADGTYWSFRAASFDGTQFTEYGRSRMNGSSFSEEERADAWNAVNSLGLYPAQIVDAPISDQVGNLELLNTVKRETTADYETIHAFIAGSGEPPMQYGETGFYSYINEGLENKINSQFVTALDIQEEAAATADYVIPDSDSRYITQEDLNKLSEYEVLLARNEIYARHGRIFNNEELNEYFTSKSWYNPTVTGADFTEEYAASVFNEFEITNITTIVQYEQAHGLNQF